MNRLPNRVLVLVLVALAAIAIAGCGGSSPAAVQTVDASKAVSMVDSRAVIDVRTPAEYAAGHIAGAPEHRRRSRRLRLEDLDARQEGPVSPLLPIRPQERDRSREGMAKAGFTDIVDGGGMADLVAAGAPTE